MRLRQLTADEVTFEIVRDDEFEAPEDGFFDDLETVEQIREEYNGGNLWAWCIVKVKAKWKGFEGFDTLGCCSYKSKEDFMQDGYYTDMKVQALEDLNRQIAETVAKISEQAKELRPLILKTA